MTKEILFYYDFSSPYTYIAHKRIRELQKKGFAKFTYCTLVLGGWHKLAGIKANAFIKNKNEFMRLDCEMVSKKLKIDFKFNNYFPISSLNLMRGSLVTSKDILDKYIDCFFDAYWKDNINLSDNEIFKNKLEDLELNVDTFLKNISNKETKEKLIKLTQDAYNKKIFGATTFICNNKIYWGSGQIRLRCGRVF